MLKTKIVYIKNIIDNAYQELRKNKEGWGKDLQKRLIQIKMINKTKDRKSLENQIKRFASSFQPFIKKIITEIIPEDTEKIVSFRLSSLRKDDKDDDREWIKTFYGLLYNYVDSELKIIIGNPIHYKKITFITKYELKCLINELDNSMEKIDKNELIEKVWKDLKK